MSTRVACLVSVLAFVAGCGGGGGTSARNAAPTPPAPPTPVVVQGAVQKGPFIVGSTVLINRLDSRGRSTPSTLLAEIKDSIGSFSFETSETGPVQIVASGYYFSELTGQISDGVLTLKALYEVSDSTRQVAHVNVLTHLINDRVLELIYDGEPSLREAIAQAEDELRCGSVGCTRGPRAQSIFVVEPLRFRRGAKQPARQCLSARVVDRLLQVREDEVAAVRHHDGCRADARAQSTLQRSGGRRPPSERPFHRRIHYCHSELEPRDDRRESSLAKLGGLPARSRRPRHLGIFESVRRHARVRMERRRSDAVAVGRPDDRGTRRQDLLVRRCWRSSHVAQQ